MGYSISGFILNPLSLFPHRQSKQNKPLKADSRLKRKSVWWDEVGDSMGFNFLIVKGLAWRCAAVL